MVSAVELPPPLARGLELAIDIVKLLEDGHADGMIAAAALSWVLADFSLQFERRSPKPDADPLAALVNQAYRLRPFLPGGRVQ